MFYLFPFGNVSQNEGIIVYGAGAIGQSFLKQLEVTQSFTNVYVIDKKIVSSKRVGNVVFLPEKDVFQLPAYQIVVASIKFGEEIKQHLIQQGVTPNRVVTIDENHAIEESQFEPHTFDWNEYYSDAEGHNEVQFQTYLEPLIRKYNFNFSRVVDFACGKGRIAELLSSFADSLVCVDTSREAIDYCDQRFRNKNNVECMVSEPERIPLDHNSIDLLYSWDAMVHFDYRSIDYILTEFSRILRSGGFAVIHHSNAREHNSFKVDKNWRRNPHCRSEFNAKDMLHLCEKSGFTVEEQQIMDWGIEALDCITVVRKS